MASTAERIGIGFATGGLSELGGLFGGGDDDPIVATGAKTKKITETGQKFLDFLLQGAPGQTGLGGAISGFDVPLQQLTAALQGEATGVLEPLISTGIESSLGAQSTALGDIEKFLARQTGGRGQFGGSRLLAQTTSDFARQRARIPLNVFTNTIQNFLPLIAQKVQAELGKAGVAQGALSSAQAFQPTSKGKPEQALQQIQSGLPPQDKDLSGLGSILGTLIGGAFGGPPGAAAGGTVGGGVGNLSFGGRNAQGSFF